IGRSSHRRGVRQNTPERDALPARRRPPAHCQPAAHVDGHQTLSRARRLMRSARRDVSGFRVQSSGFRVLVLVLVLVLVPRLLNSESRIPNPESRVANPESRSVRVGVLRPGGGYVVTEMPLEAYVARVLAGEAARDSQPAALEALAITIRTFALAN